MALAAAAASALAASSWARVSFRSFAWHTHMQQRTQTRHGSPQSNTGGSGGGGQRGGVLLLGFICQPTRQPEGIARGWQGVVVVGIHIVGYKPHCVAHGCRVGKMRACMHTRDAVESSFACTRGGQNVIECLRGAASTTDPRS
jgi:hypothetical protein